MATEVSSRLPFLFEEAIKDNAPDPPNSGFSTNAPSRDESPAKQAETDRDEPEALEDAKNDVIQNQEVPLTSQELDGIKKGLEDIESIRDITKGGFSLCGIPGCDCLVNQDSKLLGQVQHHRAQYLKHLEEVYQRFTTRHIKDDNVEHETSAKYEQSPITSEITRFVDYFGASDEVLETLPETEKPTDERSIRSPQSKASAIVLNSSVRKLYSSETKKYTYPSIRSKPLKMRIYSLVLIEALKNITDIHTCGVLSEDVLTVFEPFGHITRNLSTLSEEVVRIGTEDLKAHFELLKGFIHGYHPKLSAESELHGQPPHRCTYEMLWLLFEKGQDVIVVDRNGYRAAVVSEVQIVLEEDGRPSVTLQTWSMNFDGKDFGPCKDTIPLPVFDGIREISSLPVHPMRYHVYDGGEQKLRKDLIARGEKFWRLRKPVQRTYKGQTIASVRRYIDRKNVMVDFQTYCRLHESAITLSDSTSEDISSTCQCSDCREKRDARRKAAEASRFSADAEKLTDHQYMLLTNRVPVFILQDRQWIDVTIEGLEEHPPREEGFRRLVLPDGHAEIIEALIKTRKATGMKKIEERHDRVQGKTITDDEGMASGFHADVVRGKGNGLIILLHGAPGVGKTSTAECVAEMTNLPLYPITCGDIGTEPADVEKSLQLHFELAQLWNAVVLLDEADVFLQSRGVDHSSLQRNALVSVFLRVLEYYEGILILTTNRIGDFDEAFTSRIHIMLYYPQLEKNAIGKIWKGMKDSLEEVRPDITVSGQVEEYIFNSKDIQDTRWNGRQIRNAFQTAITLAEYEATKNNKPIMVKQSHVEKVVKLSTDFGAYLKRTMKASPDQFAAEYNIRAAEKTTSKAGSQRLSKGSGGGEDGFV